MRRDQKEFRLNSEVIGHSE